MTQPFYLTAGKAQATIAALLREAGYEGAFEIVEGEGSVEVIVRPEATDTAIAATHKRLSLMLWPGVTLKMRRAEGQRR